MTGRETLQCLSVGLARYAHDKVEGGDARVIFSDFLYAFLYHNAGCYVDSDDIYCWTVRNERTAEIVKPFTACRIVIWG